MIKLIINSDKSIDFKCLKVDKKPLDYLLISVALCLGSEIVEHIDFDKFSDVYVGFGNKRVIVKCKCDEAYKRLFRRMVGSCFILSNLKFKQEVNFL